MQATSLLPSSYFWPINKEYLSTGHTFFIGWLTAVSAAHFDANVAILKKDKRFKINYTANFVLFFLEHPVSWRG